MPQKFLSFIYQLETTYQITIPPASKLNILGLSDTYKLASSIILINVYRGWHC